MRCAEGFSGPCLFLVLILRRCAITLSTNLVSRQDSPPPTDLDDVVPDRQQVFLRDQRSRPGDPRPIEQREQLEQLVRVLHRLPIHRDETRPLLPVHDPLGQLARRERDVCLRRSLPQGDGAHGSQACSVAVPEPEGRSVHMLYSDPTVRLEIWWLSRT